MSGITEGHEMSAAVYRIKNNRQQESRTTGGTRNRGQGNKWSTRNIILSCRDRGIASRKYERNVRLARQFISVDRRRHRIIAQLAHHEWQCHHVTIPSNVMKSVNSITGVRGTSRRRWQCYRHSEQQCAADNRSSNVSITESVQQRSHRRRRNGHINGRRQYVNRTSAAHGEQTSGNRRSAGHTRQVWDGTGESAKGNVYQCVHNTSGDVNGNWWQAGE